jgi:hypothetical protein
MIDGLPNLLEQIRSVSAERNATSERREVVRIGCGDALAERIAERIPELYALMDNLAMELRTFDPSVSSLLKLADEDTDLAYLALRTPPSDASARASPVSPVVYTCPRARHRPAGCRRSCPSSRRPTFFLSRDFDQAVRLCGIASHHVVARVIAASHPTWRSPASAR